MKLDRIANTAITIVCILMAIYVGRRLYVETRPMQTGQPQEAIAEGYVLQNSEELSFKESAATVILVTSSQCRFCTDSMPFYRRVVETASKLDGVRVVGATREDLLVNAGYLSSHGVKVRQIVSAIEHGIITTGTPVVVLVDASGRILKLWRGRLPQKIEAEVLATLVPKPAGN